MLSANDIKNVRFSKFMGGYKQEEVDVLLDQVEADYFQFERILQESQIKIKTYENEIKELKSSQDSLQNVLISAQSLADRIVNEAKEKSEEIIHSAENSIIAITEKEKELSANFELKAQARRESLEKELDEMVREAQLKADSITAAANDSVARQQMLYDKLKFQVATFKNAITAKYKEHIELLSQMPDNVPGDPQYLANVVAADLENMPETQKYIEESVAKETAEEIPEEAAKETSEETAVEIAADKKTAFGGFVIEDIKSNS